MDKYKVVIVDDDDVALENLSFELWKDARFSLEGTARNGRKGKKLIRGEKRSVSICGRSENE